MKKTSVSHHLGAAFAVALLGSSLGVSLASGHSEGPVFETHIYSIAPRVLQGEHPSQRELGAMPSSADLVNYFKEKGVPFPPGSAVNYKDRTMTLIVTNTPDNLKVLERVLIELNFLPTQVTIEARFLQMTRETANDLFKPEVTLGRASVLNGEVLRRMRDLEEQKRITVLAQPKLTTVSGNTAQVKSVAEYRYPTEFSFPTPPATNAPSQVTKDAFFPIPGGFETREIGSLLNVTPTLAPDGQTINLTLVPEISERLGSSKIEVSLPNGKVVVEQPRFSSRQLTTTVQLHSGTTILLGVADPIEGGEDKSQVTLILLTATVVPIE